MTGYLCEKHPFYAAKLGIWVRPKSGIRLQAVTYLPQIYSVRYTVVTIRKSLNKHEVMS